MRFPFDEFAIKIASKKDTEKPAHCLLALWQSAMCEGVEVVVPALPPMMSRLLCLVALLLAAPADARSAVRSDRAPQHLAIISRGSQSPGPFFRRFVNERSGGSSSSSRNSGDTSTRADQGAFEAPHGDVYRRDDHMAADTCGAFAAGACACM